MGLEEKAGMILDEKTVGVWFIATIPGRQDWMAAVREAVPDEKYELVYRFRYYADDKPHDSEDRKSWYSGTVTGTRSYVVASIRTVAKMLEKQSHGEPMFELLNEKGIDQFMRDFMNLPFVFAKMVPIEKVI